MNDSNKRVKIRQPARLTTRSSTDVSPRRKVAHAARGMRSGTPSDRRIFNPARSKPVPKHWLAIVLVALLFSALLFTTVFDLTRNWGVIHYGINIAGVDVGGYSKEDAKTILSQTIGKQILAQQVTLFADEQALQAGSNEQTIDMDKGVGNYDDSDLLATASSWQISAAGLQAEPDINALLDEAANIGWGADILFGRIAANTVGIDLPIRMNYSANRIAQLTGTITAALGTEMVNPTVVLAGNNFTVVAGKDGFEPDAERLKQMLTEALTGGETKLLVPMATREQDVSFEDATAMAEWVQKKTNINASLAFEGNSYKISPETLRSWIKVEIEHSVNQKDSLIAHFDKKLIEQSITTVIGDLSLGVPPTNASYINVDGNLQIVDSRDGTGLNVERLANELNTNVISSDSDEFNTDLTIGVLQPEFTTVMASSYNLPDKICEFTTSYAGTRATKIHNIHKAADYINGTLIAPTSIWSFNETVGEANEEHGFVTDQAIINDEAADAIGGGICQVATTVFNVAYEAGLPIEQRTNHSLYFDGYPAGRDAAIAWPYFDLQFRNDTNNWLLLTINYDDSTITVTLWGTNPGNRVETILGEWEPGAKYKTVEKLNPELPDGTRTVKTEGEDGRAIDVKRIVYDKYGTLVRESVFRSTYNPVTEVIEVGPNTPAEPSQSPSQNPTQNATQEPAQDSAQSSAQSAAQSAA